MRQQAIPIEVALLGLHGPVTGSSLVAAAVPALARVEGTEHTAAVDARRRVAAVRTRVDVAAGGGVAPVGDGGGLRRLAGRVIVQRIHEVALARVDRLAHIELEAEQAVPALTGTAADHLHALVVATALLGTASAHVDVHALEVVLEDDVDHAGDGIGAVHRRCTGSQHLDALDQRARNVGQVDHVHRTFVGQWVVGLALMVLAAGVNVLPKSSPCTLPVFSVRALNA
ncbi:hypothetical protein G6F22_016977 [Rhizopus arrhizus]|nr:hypothetical protein G6F22_016977 [Rhizopus arrhizus]